MEGDDMAPERARLWRAVRARVRRPRKRRRLPRRVALALAATLGAAAAFALFSLHWVPVPSAAPQAQRDRPAALLVADGRPLEVIDAQAGDRIVRLSDRSEIRLDRGARIEPVLSTSSRFELLLARGAAEFAVTPGGPRRWSIEAGPARIEVVGTVFRVARTPERVEVSVSRGVVLVFGEEVPGRVRRLVAGESVTISVRAEGAAAQPPPDSLGHAARPLDLPTSAATGANAAASGPLPREGGLPRAKRRAVASSESKPRAESPHERYAQLGPAGLARETMKATSIEQLLELADVARLSGHPQDAVAPLTRALDAFRGDPQAALAAFTLGRVLLDQLGVAKPAAEAFERAIVLGLPKALRADCYRRLAEAYGRDGNEVERARAEARFQTEFVLPSGSLDKVAP